MVTFVIMIILYFAAWYIFRHSYETSLTTGQKMENIQAAAQIIEYLRHEITALPHFDNIDDDFIANKVSERIAYEKKPPGAEAGSGKSATGGRVTTDDGTSRTVRIVYTFDKDKKIIVREVNGMTTPFGHGLISEFKLTHNIDKEKPKFPTWVKVRIKTVSDHKAEIELEATIYPRLINRNIQLEQTL